MVCLFGQNLAQVTPELSILSLTPRLLTSDLSYTFSWSHIPELYLNFLSNLQMALNFFLKSNSSMTKSSVGSLVAIIVARNNVTYLWIPHLGVFKINISFKSFDTILIGSNWFACYLVEKYQIPPRPSTFAPPSRTGGGGSIFVIQWPVNFLQTFVCIGASFLSTP